MNSTIDERDVSDTSSFVLTLAEIGALTSEQAKVLISEMKRENLLPQAMTQACASFVVRNRESEIKPSGRAAYILRSAHIQNTRLRGEE